MIGDSARLVLKMVRDHNGEWGWYQFDRALSRRGIGEVDIQSAIIQLRDGGLIVGLGDVREAATRYTITEAGEAVLASID